MRFKGIHRGSETTFASILSTAKKGGTNASSLMEIYIKENNSSNMKAALSLQSNRIEFGSEQSDFTLSRPMASEKRLTLSLVAKMLE